MLKRLYILIVLLISVSIYSEELSHEQFVRHVIPYFSGEPDFPKEPSVEDCFNYLKMKGIEPKGGFASEKTMSIDESVQLFGKIIAVNHSFEKKMNENVDQYFKNRLTFLKVSGQVLVQLKDSTDWKSAYEDMQVKEGDQIKTDDNSWAQLKVGTLGVVLLKPNSHLDLASMKLEVDGQHENIHLHLNSGKLLINVQGMPKKASLKTSTPSTIVAVRGTIYEVVAD